MILKLLYGELRIEIGELQKASASLHIQNGELQIEFGESRIEFGELQIAGASLHIGSGESRAASVQAPIRCVNRIFP
jgi:hypothetical protein